MPNIGDLMNIKAQQVLEFNKVKEILSEYALSPMAKEMAMELEPTSDEFLVRIYQRETTEGVSLLRSGINLPLEGLRDLKNSLRLTRVGGILTPKELLDIASTMKASRLTKELWKEKRLENCKIINDLIEGLNIFESIEQKILKSILSEDEIADQASPTLSNIRRQKRALTQNIREKLESIVNSPHYQKILQEPIVTMRKDRYVVPVKQEFKGSLPGVIHDQSASGSTLYIEPMAVLAMNNELSQKEIEEKKEIERILRDLTAKIEDNHDLLLYTWESLIKLDFIMAKALYSLNIRGVEPVYNINGYVNIKKGRHPLLKGEVVPIDVFLGDKFNVLVITGPNTGGKTVSLKTVGLMALMGQSGLHIPAEYGTELSVFEEVFADIGDEQSIEQSLSTFSSHMKNIKEIIEQVSAKSLVLLDELGAGTDPTEGAALAMSILEYLLEKGCRVIATTHYSELKNFAYSTKGVENASVEFDVKTLSPTYKLTIGIPGKSNAFEIAERLGLKRDIIERSRELLTSESLKMEDLLKHIEMEKNKAESEKQELELLKKAYQKKLDQLEEEKEKARVQREKLLEKAREKARLIVENVEREANTIIEQLKEDEVKSVKQIRDKAIADTRKWLKQTSDELQGARESIIKKVKTKGGPLKPGEKVKIAGLNQEGYIVSIDYDGKSAMVQVGIMKMNVPTESLIKIEEEIGQLEKNKYTSIAMEKAKNISTEIDLRGLTLDEALIKVDKYLDDTYLAGISSVYIIHGKGTGVLRKGITEMLKKRKEVKSFRPGNINEGGLGVTVVDFKL